MKLNWQDIYSKSKARALFRLAMCWNMILHFPRTVARFSSKEARGFYRVLTAWYRWVYADDLKKAIKLAASEKRANLIKDRNEEIAKNWKITLVILVILLVGSLFAVQWFGWNAIAILILMIVVSMYVIGFSSDSEEESEQRITPLIEGMPLASVRRSITAVLEERCRTTADVSVQNAKNGWTFVASFITSRPDDDKIIKELEEGLGLPKNSLSLVEDPTNAANELGTIQLINPLEKTPYLPALKPNSLSINDPIPVGMNQDGSPLELNLCRTNWLLVGRSDSGKSTAINAVALRLSECEDVLLSSIDITGAVTFRAHRGCIARRAETNEDAVALLRDELAIIDDRTRKMSDNLETGDVVSSLVPTPEVPARVLLVDELPALADDQVFIRLLLLYLLRGRKVACSAVIGTQGVSEKIAGSAVFREAVHGLVLFACGELDIKNALGADARRKGWRADTLRSPGECYVRDRKRLVPAVSRFSDIAIKDVAERSLELQGHRPKILPPVILTDVHRVFENLDMDFCGQDELLHSLDYDWTKSDLKRALEREGIRLRQNTRIEGRPRGYFRSDVDSVMEKLS